MRRLIVMCLVLVIAGCAGYRPAPIEHKGLPVPLNAGRVVPVENFTGTVELVEPFQRPDHEIEIRGERPLPVARWLELALIGLPTNVMYQNIRELDTPELVVRYYKGSLSGFVDLLQEQSGLYIHWDSKGIRLSDSEKHFLRVFVPGGGKSVLDALKSFGIEGATYDAVNGRVIYETDYATQQKVSRYFRDMLRNMALVNMRVLVSEVELSDEWKEGIDWTQLVATVGLPHGTNASKPTFELKSGPAGHSVTVNLGRATVSDVLQSLKVFGDTRVLQNVRLAVLSGDKGKIDVSRKVPYVAAVQLGSLTANATAVVQGVTFNEVDSGVVVEVAPYCEGDLVKTDISARIQRVVEFLEVGTSGLGIQRPVVSVRNIATQALLKGGDVIAIGGLLSERNESTFKGLSRGSVGVRGNVSERSELVILIEAELTRYVVR